MPVLLFDQQDVSGFPPQKPDTTEEQLKNADQVSRMLSVTLRCAYSPDNPWPVLDGWTFLYTYLFDQEAGIAASYPYLSDAETQELFARFWQQDILPNEQASACLQDPAIYDPITEILMSNAQSAVSVSTDSGLPIVAVEASRLIGRAQDRSQIVQMRFCKPLKPRLRSQPQRQHKSLMCHP